MREDWYLIAPCLVPLIWTVEWHRQLYAYSLRAEYRRLGRPVDFRPHSFFRPRLPLALSAAHLLLFVGLSHLVGDKPWVPRTAWHQQIPFWIVGLTPMFLAFRYGRPSVEEALGDDRTAP